MSAVLPAQCYFRNFPANRTRLSKLLSVRRSPKWPYASRRTAPGPASLLLLVRSDDEIGANATDGRSGKARALLSALSGSAADALEMHLPRAMQVRPP